MYKTKSGDTWDGIANEVYGDEMQADVLIAANRAYGEVFIFDSGVELIVPEIENRIAENNLPPWKKAK